MGDEDDDDLIPDSGAVFTFGRSRFADNIANKFWIKNDPVVQISCGDEHSAVVTERGRVYVFGSNDWGQLGLGHQKPSNKPAFIKALKSEKILLVACGRAHTLLYSENERIYSFGGNQDSQLGHADKQTELAPRCMDEMPRVKIKELSCGAYHSAALADNGHVYIWGQNAEGQCGFGEEEEISTPRKLDVDEKIISVSCGFYHTAVVTSSGLIYIFGENESGKLGLTDDVLDDTKVPQKLPKLSKDGYIKVACGAGHTVAITKNGFCYSWGDGSHGQIGHGTMAQEIETPRKIEALSQFRIVDVSCGDSHTAVLTDTNKIYTFGNGRHGKLGQGDECFSNLFKPTIIKRFRQFFVNQVSCGGCHMLVQAVRKQDEVDGNEEDESDSLISSMKSEYSLKEANMTLKPGNMTFPVVSPRDKRRLKDEQLNNSINLNGSANLNNSLTMAQLSKTLPELPAKLDRNRLPKIPGLEKKGIPPKTVNDSFDDVDAVPKRSLNDGKIIENADTKDNAPKPKRLVAEISFSRRPKKIENNPLDRRKEEPNNNIKETVFKENNKNKLPPLTSLSDEEDDMTEDEESETEAVPQKPMLKTSTPLKPLSSKKQETSDIESNYESDEEENINIKKPLKPPSRQKSKKDLVDDEDEDEEESDEVEKPQKKKSIKKKPVPAPRKKPPPVEEDSEDEEYESEEEDGEEEESEEEPPPRKMKGKNKTKEQQKPNKKPTKKNNEPIKKGKNRKKIVESEVEETEDEDEEEDEYEEVVPKRSKQKKKKILAESEEEEEDEEEEDDEEEEEAIKNKKKAKKKKLQSPSKTKSKKADVKKKKHLDDDDDDEEEEEEEEDEEDEEDEDDDEGKTKNGDKKKDEDSTKANEAPQKSKSGFLNFFRRNKKGAVGDSTSSSKEKLKEDEKEGTAQSSKTCTIL